MTNLLRICVVLTLSVFFIATIPSGYARKHGPRDLQHRRENTTEIRFYLHDLLGGENASVHEVARASITANSSTGFGQVSVFDDLLTVQPDINSEVLGRAQGLVASADFVETAINVNLNIVFTGGEYNGSTITILGRNALLNAQREMSIVGGTGVFRSAHGYCLASTYSEDVANNYAVREFTLHFTYPTN